MSDFHFLRPTALLLLLPLTLLLWLLSKQKTTGGNWQQVCDSHLLRYLIVGTFEKSYRPLLLLATTWLIAVLALAGPTWQRTLQPVYRSSEAQIIVLDLSPEMGATDVSPNRFTRAKYKIIDILHKYREGQIGMVAFSGEPYVVSPLTDDAETIAAMVPELNPDIMPVSGHNIGSALEKAAQLLKQQVMSQGNIVLITGSTPQASDLAIARQLRKQGIILSVLSVGTKTGAPIPQNGGGFLLDQQGAIHIAKLDSKTLQQLAQLGGGRHVAFSNDDRDINQLFTPQHSSYKRSSLVHQQWQDQGHWLVLLILPFALLIFRRGWLETL